jgi:hypothetical protein
MDIKPKDSKSKTDWVQVFMLFLACLLGVFVLYCSYTHVKYESSRNPLELGVHDDYTITCENGFKYKILSDRRGVIQLLGKDAKPLRCK